MTSEKSQKKDSKQMELNLPKSSRVVSRASRLVSQEVEKEQMTTDIFGQKCLESLKSLSQGGLLAKMCEALLVSKTAWYSRQCALTWKVKVTSQTFNIPAVGVGAPHKSERIWIVANSRCSVRREQSSRNSESIRSGTFKETERSTDTSEITRPSERAETMADTYNNGSRKEKRNETIESSYKQKTGYLSEMVTMWPTPTQGMRKQEQCRPKSIQEEGNELECSSSQSGGNFWDIEPDVGRVVNGLPGRVHRLKGLGNAIVPQIAEEIGRAIMKAEQ